MASFEDIWGEDISPDPLFHDDEPGGSPSKSANGGTAPTNAIADTTVTFDDDFDFDFTVQRVDQVAILKEANARNSRQVLAASLSNDRPKRPDGQPDSEGRLENGKKPRVIPKLDDDR